VVFVEKLRKFLAPEFLYGSGALELTGQYCRNWDAKKVLIVTDPGVREAGWTKKVEDSLIREKVPYDIYDEILPNPRDFQCHKGLDFYREAHCDVIVAVGGGSVLDAAKGIGILVSNGGDILNYEGVDQIDRPMPPLICIPTTSGSSADVSQFAIITDTENKKKIAIISKAVVPDLSLIDPETLLTMDRTLTAATCMDALTHAVEAYVSLAHSFMTDRHALGAVELIGTYLPQLMRNLNDRNLRCYTMQASLEAGLAFSNASLGLVHSMAHALGGGKDLPHGVCNTILLKEVCRYNREQVPERFKTLARTLNAETIEEAIERLLDCTGIDPSLKSLGLTSRDLPDLAHNAYIDPCTATNPRNPTVEDIIEIYERSF